MSIPKTNIANTAIIAIATIRIVVPRSCLRSDMNAAPNPFRCLALEAILVEIFRAFEIGAYRFTDSGDYTLRSAGLAYHFRGCHATRAGSLGLRPCVGLKPAFSG